MGADATVAASRAWASGGAWTCRRCSNHRLECDFASAVTGGLHSILVFLGPRMLLDGPAAKLIKQDLAAAVPVKPWQEHKSGPPSELCGQVQITTQVYVRHTHVSISRKADSASLICMPHSTCKAAACRQPSTSWRDIMNAQMRQHPDS